MAVEVNLRTYPASASTHYIDEYHVPTVGSAPLAIAVDSEGTVWFTESNASKLGSYDPQTSSFKEYRVPGVGDMWGLVPDNDGHVWITQYAGKGSVSPGGAIIPGGTGRLLCFNIKNESFTAVSIPGEGVFPMRIVIDHESRVWFTEFLGDKIGEYEPTRNLLTEYAVPTNASGPADLAFDNAGALWFTEAYAQKVGKLNVETRTFSEYDLSSGTSSNIVSSPVGIAVDAKGEVWVADHGGNWIVRYDSVTESETHYPLQVPPENVYPLAIPNGLLIDGRGRIWFSEHGGNSIGYLTPDGQMMVEYAIPTGPISTTLWIALAPNCDVWFAEWSSNKIGVVHSASLVPIKPHVSTSSMTIQAGNSVSVTASAEIIQGLGGNGTWDYSWSSYNPQLVQVDFSPRYPSLGETGSVQTQAKVIVSSSVEAGNYTLAIGIDQGEIRVWTMLSVRVTRVVSGSTNPYLGLLPIVIIFAAILLFLLTRRRPSNPLPD